MVLKPSLACGLQACIGKLWRKDDFSDFTVVVEDTSFPCHRFILSACSSFFERMFRSKMKECQENLAKIGGMTKHTFSVILRSLYKGINGLTEDNIFDIWSATVQLQIRYLIEECENFVKKNMTTNNCFSILHHANLFSSQKVVNYSLKFMSKQFEQIRNMENLLQLSFDDLYRVVRCDYLTISSEDFVVETVIKWVEYNEDINLEDTTSEHVGNSLGTSNAHTLPIDRNNQDKNLNSTLCPSTDISAVSTCDSESQKETVKEHSGIAQQAENDQTNNLSGDLRNTEKGEKVEVSITADCVSICHSDGGGGVARTARENRRKYLYKLISVCRVRLMSSSCLKNLLKNNELILLNRQVHNVLFDALMYIQCVEHRHDCWPESAIHRLPSIMKHVMVFITGRFIKLYDLNSGYIRNYLDPSTVLKDDVTITVFDNVLYACGLLQGNLYMYSREQKWWPVGDTGFACGMLLPHGQYLYSCRASLQRHHCLHGHTTEWTQVCKLTPAGFLSRFQDYILSFYIENTNISAESYNTVTGSVFKITKSLPGEFINMISFSHQGNVYILQQNGFLWMIISTEKDLVDFKFISKLWNFNCHLHGGVVYKRKLFVFCSEDEAIKPESCVASVPGIFEAIKIVQVNSKTQCLPLVIRKFW